MNRNEYLNFNLFLNLIKFVKVDNMLKQGILMLSLSSVKVNRNSL